MLDRLKNKLVGEGAQRTTVTERSNLNELLMYQLHVVVETCGVLSTLRRNLNLPGELDA